MIIEEFALYYFRLIRSFIRASLQDEMAHRSNFWISLLHSTLNLVTGVMGVGVLFGQVESINGWNFPSTLAILGVYLTVGALRGLFIGPSLDALAGMDGEVWTGKLDFTLLRPVDVQFQASFRHWRPFRLLDLGFGIGVLGVALIQLGQALTFSLAAQFVITLFLSVTILYAILLIFAGLVFWSPGFLFTWVFDGIFQMARYPVGLYPGWVQLILTWIIPVGVITTIPVQALTGSMPASAFGTTLLIAAVLLIGGTIVFRSGLRRYASASS
jgi:ABC-2 type transport system permease protein